MAEESPTLKNPFVSVAFVVKGNHTVGGIRLVVASITWMRPGTPPIVNAKLPFERRRKPVNAGGGRSLTITLVVAE